MGEVKFTIFSAFAYGSITEKKSASIKKWDTFTINDG